MATGMTTGLTPARVVGSAPDNKGLNEYTIASGYATALGSGDPVKLSSGTIVKATNGVNALGVFLSTHYYDDNTKRIIDNKYWPASQTSTMPITALVLDNPFATFFVKANGPVANVKIGNLYALDVTTAPDSNIGRSKCTATILPVITGSLAVTGTNNAALTGLTNNAAFSIKSSIANVATTITIITNQTPAQLLTLLNAVPGIKASYNGSNFLVVTTTDGGDVVLVDGTSTPLASSNLLAVAGTYTGTVAAGSALVEVVKIADTDNNVLEVILSRHQFRDNDA